MILNLLWCGGDDNDIFVLVVGVMIIMILNVLWW